MRTTLQVSRWHVVLFALMAIGAAAIALAATGESSIEREYLAPLVVAIIASAVTGWFSANHGARRGAEIAMARFDERLKTTERDLAKLERLELGAVVQKVRDLDTLINEPRHGIGPRVQYIANRLTALLARAGMLRAGDDTPEG